MSKHTVQLYSIILQNHYLRNFNIQFTIVIYTTVNILTCEMTMWCILFNNHSKETIIDSMHGKYPLCHKKTENCSRN